MNDRRRVSLCATCLVDQVLPEVGVSAVRLLERAGCRVDFPSEQTCCGQPWFNAGYRREARRLARRTVRAFESAETVVLPSGSCASMIRVEYPTLLGGTPLGASARRLAERTYELSEFLTRVARWEPALADDAPAVSYHDSCHMRRHLQLHREPRQLLSAAGCALEEMVEPERCCGFGGLFSLKMPEAANAMSAEKLKQAAATGGQLLITADPGCLLQLRGLAPGGVRVEHLASVLEALTR